MREVPRMPNVPLIGGVTVRIDDAEPIDIVMEIAKYMPHYAQAVGQHVQSTEAMLGECIKVLKAMGHTEVRRANISLPREAPNDINGGNGGPIGVE
jgi:hypothetical protein